MQLHLPEHTSQAVQDVLSERSKQIRMGYTASHDDQHGPRTLMAYGVEYLEMFGSWTGSIISSEPTSEDRAHLVKAAAVILATIEVMDRAAPPPKPMTATGYTARNIGDHP